MYKEKYQTIRSNKYPKEGGTGVIDWMPGTAENRPPPWTFLPRAVSLYAGGLSRRSIDCRLYSVCILNPLQSVWKHTNKIATLHGSKATCSPRNKRGLIFLSAGSSSYGRYSDIKTHLFLLLGGKMAGGVRRLYCLEAIKLPYLLVTKYLPFGWLILRLICYIAHSGWKSLNKMIPLSWRDHHLKTKCFLLLRAPQFLTLIKVLLFPRGSLWDQAFY